MVWELTLIELDDGRGTLYKVTRRLPEMTVAETRTYRTRAAALRKLREWTAVSR